MRETSRSGAIVSAVVAVLEKQKNDTDVKKTELCENFKKNRQINEKSFKNPEKITPDLSNSKSDLYTPKTDYFTPQNEFFNTPTNFFTSDAFFKPKSDLNSIITEDKKEQQLRDINLIGTNKITTPPITTTTTPRNTGVIIREFIYKDKDAIFYNKPPETETDISEYHHPLLFVKQKDPKLLKNTSYVIVKKDELNKNQHKKDSYSDDDVGDKNGGDSFFPNSSSPTSNTKNKPQYIQETNSGNYSNSTRQFATTIQQTRANNNIFKKTNYTDTLAENNKIQTAADRNFETAIKNFDRTAEDVQKYVLKDKSDNNSTEETDVIFRNKQYESDKKERFSSTTDSTSNVSDEFDDSSSSSDDSSSSDSERNINEGLETITEEDRTAGSSFKSNLGDSSSNEEGDDSTLKGHEEWDDRYSQHGSTSEFSSSSSLDRRKNKTKDSSTRCNSDFQWIRKESTIKMEDPVPQSKPPINRNQRDKTPRRSAERTTAPGSLDRRRHLQQNRHERDQKSRSTHSIKSPPRFDDYNQICQNWCCNPHGNISGIGGDGIYFDNFHRRHERIDPQRYGSNPMLIEHQRLSSERGSHPDLYNNVDCRYRHEPPIGCWCHMPPPPPPCCFMGDGRNYHWTPPPFIKPTDTDEKVRKLQSERDNLQLQVQVLSEQIEAQTDKITDLEKTLLDKKQHLANTEDMLQREMLSRSSLETQKLELLTAMSELKLHQAALERENLELKASQINNNENLKKTLMAARASPQPQITSTPIHHSSNQALNMRMSPSPSPVSCSSNNSPRRIDTTSLQYETQPPKTPPANYRRQIELHYASLPRQQFLSNGGTLTTVDSNANPSNGARKGVAFGRGFSSLLGGRARGHSVPNLGDSSCLSAAETEKIVIEDVQEEPQSPSLTINKNKGIKKIFSKMKRSNSGNLEDLPGLGEFQRGGVRATAAARLGWSEPHISRTPDKPFAEWDTNEICNWLEDMGLEQYLQEAKRWITSGIQLQETAINEIEKELGIKNSLHRKKLQLAIIDTQENSSSDPYLKMAGKLDTAWVLRWLDDTGLPQHKEAFLINKIDGRVLHRLTIDDLAQLHVTSMLHVASLKRGIQVLRENNYISGCLQRRSLPEDPTQPTSKQISLWTTHRVMEWLKAVDLAEYAPNLRGAGVHGGLMVLENKFTAELLATLLSIPPGKTLLRRHLNTHFKELLGKEVIQAKREAEATLGYIPLTPSTKLKIAKKSHFSLKRSKSKSEADYGDLLCPLNETQSGEQNGSAINSCVGMTKMENLKEEDVYQHVNVRSYPSSATNSPIPERHV